MRTWIRIVAALLFTMVVAGVTTASADTVKGVGIVAGTRYRGGVQSAGEVNYAVSLQVSKDPTGAITKVRGVGRITKVSKASAVQVDGVVLGTATSAVVSNGTDVNSGTGSTAISYTSWRAVSPGTCTDYRTRANFSVRWTDAAVSRFSILSPLTRVCRSAQAKVYANCDAMHIDFPHGVGRVGAVDKTSGTPVTNFYVSTFIYNANASGRDADKDGIACERR